MQPAKPHHCGANVIPFPALRAPLHPPASPACNSLEVIHMGTSLSLLAPAAPQACSFHLPSSLQPMERQARGYVRHPFIANKSSQSDGIATTAGRRR